MLERLDKTVMHSYPGMVALVTVAVEEEHNIMACGWHTYISYEPPMYGVSIGRERYSYQLLKKAGKFAINFLPFEKAEVIQKAGVTSGADTDKLSTQAFIEGETMGAPILKEAYVAYECETVDVKTYGDHDFFVADLVGFYRDEALFLSNGLPNLQQLSIPLYLGRSRYIKLDDRVGYKDFLK